MAHEIVVFDNGQASLRDPATGEPMHSRLGPWAEAMRVHAEPSGLARRILESRADARLDGSGPLVVLDLGMGIATNALAAIDVASRVPGPKRELRILSIDTQKEGLAKAAERPDLFSFASHPGVRALLDGSHWKGPGVGWELRLGDFREMDLEDAQPEIVFFDFYSPRSSPHLWTSEVFAKLHDLGASVLTTYSAATSARAAMMLGGFFVGEGGRAGDKSHTTVAARAREDLAEPLGEAWWRKFEASSRPLPPEWSGARQDEAREIIRARLRF